ncbi:major facilitator superfamily domain-containing protein [Gongronella butleri]|nr:major facilitator superfamily domain-containing protein [Gongronella butleri]
MSDSIDDRTHGATALGNAQAAAPADALHDASKPQTMSPAGTAESITTVYEKTDDKPLDGMDDDETGEELTKQITNIDDFEERPYGWLVVLGAFLVQVTSFGTATSWGVMQDYYEKIFGESQTLNLSFVGTIALICINVSAPLAQIIASLLGTRIAMAIGTICVTMGLITAGWATQIWHLYLSQGVLFGFGASIMYCSIMSIAPLWFNKRRGLALGVVTSGSGIGGLVLPFLMTAVNAKLGPGWTYRILGFVCFGCDVLATILVKPRVPVPRQRKKLSDIIQLEVLKNVNMMLFTVGSLVALFGYFIPYFFLPSYATYKNMDSTQGAALVAVSSACNFVGRILAGFTADYMGQLNTNILFTALGGLSSLLIWTFADSYGVLMAYSAIFGIFCGSYFALLSPILTQIVGFKKFPTALSILLIGNAISVFGPNIASAIESSVSSPPYFSYKMFSGAAYLLGALILCVLKLRINRNVFAKV